MVKSLFESVVALWHQICLIQSSEVFSLKLYKKKTTVYNKIVCYYHVTYAFHIESRLYSCANVKELLAQNMYNIWVLSDCIENRIHYHLVHRLVWSRGFVFLYEISGCGFESHCCHLDSNNFCICCGIWYNTWWLTYSVNWKLMRMIFIWSEFLYLNLWKNQIFVKVISDN